MLDIRKIIKFSNFPNFKEYIVLFFCHSFFITFSFILIGMFIFFESNIFGSIFFLFCNILFIYPFYYVDKKIYITYKEKHDNKKV